MTDHSRGKRRFPKGLPIETEPKGRKKSQMATPAGGIALGSPAVPGWSAIRNKPINRGPLMIRKAYFEPLGTTLVENILLQRDFIID